MSKLIKILNDLMRNLNHSEWEFSKKGRQATQSRIQRDIRLDKVDFKIISLLVTGHDNKQISKDLKIPLSTIQRRVRNILANDIVNIKIQPNFKRLGIKKGLVHIYLNNGDIKESIDKVTNMDGILSAAVHVGNSDIVGEFVYEDSEQLIDAISDIKHMDGVDRVLWSEEVYSILSNPENILSSFKKFWNNNNNKHSNNHNNHGINNNTNNGNYTRKQNKNRIPSNIESWNE